MANSAVSLYALGLDQIENAIRVGGSKRTILVQGHMGTGKSSLLRTLAKALPDHTACYFDCTTKDLGDITIPQLQTLDDQGFVRYVTHEELGLHLGKPIILMIDEYGKANPAVKNALLRLLLERKLGSYDLHPDSIIFATTNLGAEGVGDLLPPHARNRMTVITARKPTTLEWIEWGITNGVDHAALSFAKDNPHIFQSFEDVPNPDDNPYIYHPKAPRTAFVTPRSMEAASDWLKIRDSVDDQTLTAMLIGTIGERGAMDLMAHVRMADQLPKLEDIKRDPMHAKVPDSPAAVCMVVYRTLQVIERDWMDAWMDYMQRLDKEAQGMFANGVRADKYPKQSIVMTNKKFTQWAMANNYMFTAEKK
jgi:energy-coupling factor transporter ATP-binding protein EcfA2